MGRLIIILIILSSNIHAMGSNSSGSTWVNDWWANDFSSVQAQQVQKIQGEMGLSVDLTHVCCIIS